MVQRVIDGCNDVDKANRMDTKWIYVPSSCRIEGMKQERQQIARVQQT